MPIYLLSCRGIKFVCDNQSMKPTMSLITGEEIFRTVEQCMSFILVQIRWPPLVVVDKWSLFRCIFTAETAWVGFRVVFVDNWSLFGGAVISTGLAEILLLKNSGNDKYKLFGTRIKHSTILKNNINITHYLTKVIMWKGVCHWVFVQIRKIKL